MSCKNKVITILLFFLVSTNINAGIIKHIFIDINAIVATSTSASSKIIGIINSMKYTAIVGHIPSKADYFKALKSIPALSEEQTYNEGLKMPLILSDWLLGLQTNSVIHSVIHQHLNKQPISSIEKSIFKNISSMMMSASVFIDTQYLMKDFSKIFHTLKKSGFTLYLIGNWDKESEPLLMKLLNGNSLPDARHCYFSNKAKHLKPNVDYFEKLLDNYNLTKRECLIIDVDKNHAQSARNTGFNTILLHTHSPAQLKSELARVGIRV